MSATPPNRADLDVMVIDDEALVQKLMKATLTLLGVHKIQITSDGRKALEAVQSKEGTGKAFDVVIVDWDMPVMDGIGFLEIFRKDNKDAVVIMVTARTSSADFNEAKRKGADYFFMKPLDVNMLKLRLGAAIDAVLKKR